MKGDYGGCRAIAINKKDKILAIFTIVLVITIWIIGRSQNQKDLIPFLHRALPQTSDFKPITSRLYIGIRTNQSGIDTTGYVALGSGSGYGGPMLIAVGIDKSQSITNAVFIDHKETIPFFQKILAKNIPSSLSGTLYLDLLEKEKQFDGVTGASRTLKAFEESLRDAIVTFSSNQLDYIPPKSEKKPIELGFKEIILLILFFFGFYNLYQKSFNKKWIRWGIIISSTILIGFVYSIPLTLVNINSILLGYWPDWHSGIYWYFLIIGIFVSILFLGRSPYCEGICPFGATQECLAFIGHTKSKVSPYIHKYLRWLQRLLALSIILLALWHQNPGIPNYEVFGSLFNLTGSNLQFIILFVVIVSSLFVLRPWCNYLCPIRAVTDYIKFCRKWIMKK